MQTTSREDQKHVSNLHPQYVVGFVDGEGSFHVAIYKDPLMTTGIKLIPEFHVSQRKTSRSVLDQLVEAFVCGYVKANHATNPNDQTYVYVVRDRHDLLTKIIPFFEKNPLKTEKQSDFLCFAEIVRRMDQGEHRDKDRLSELLRLAYKMNQAGKYRRKKHTL